MESLCHNRPALSWCKTNSQGPATRRCRLASLLAVASGYEVASQWFVGVPTYESRHLGGEVDRHGQPRSTGYVGSATVGESYRPIIMGVRCQVEARNIIVRVLGVLGNGGDYSLEIDRPQPSPWRARQVGRRPDCPLHNGVICAGEPSPASGNAGSLTTGRAWAPRVPVVDADPILRAINREVFQRPATDGSSVRSPFASLRRPRTRFVDHIPLHTGTHLSVELLRLDHEVIWVVQPRSCALGWSSLASASPTWRALPWCTRPALGPGRCSAPTGRPKSQRRGLSGVA